MHKDDEPPLFPIFTNYDIGEYYRAGLYQSRAEAEVDDILQSSSLADKSQSEQKSERMPLTLDIAHMGCVAIISNGNIIPVMSFDKIDPPQTVAQQMALCALAARALIDSLLEVFARWYKREDDNGSESDVPM